MGSDYYLTGYVYFIQAGEESAVKIGSTIEHVEKRRLALQTSNHHDLKVIGLIDIRKESGKNELDRIQYSALARKRETQIQSHFEKDKIRGEWFNLSKELRDYIFKHSNAL
ncbi:GIY-YIG nuclease family protein [Glaciecola siphonariae]|uniref:GIY-YIG nuclease family protein n=1 Tax=Glaciecola siphonariae TaxID=521012 RepID=A0ABV9M0J4_9ALTE